MALPHFVFVSGCSTVASVNILKTDHVVSLGNMAAILVDPLRAFERDLDSHFSHWLYSHCYADCFCGCCCTHCFYFVSVAAVDVHASVFGLDSVASVALQSGCNCYCLCVCSIRHEHAFEYAHSLSRTS